MLLTLSFAVFHDVHGDLQGTSGIGAVDPSSEAVISGSLVAFAARTSVSWVVFPLTWAP